MARPIDDIADAIKNAIIDALKDREDELKAIAAAGKDTGGGNFLNDIGALADVLGAAGAILTTVIAVTNPELAPLIAAEKAAGKLGEGIGLGWLFGNAAYAAMGPLFEPANHLIADLVQTEIFDPRTAAQLEAQGILTNAQGRSEAAGGNLSGEHYDKLVDMLRQRPELAQLLELWNRGDIDETAVDGALQRHGIPSFWWGPLKELRRNLLSPADLALAFLRSEIDEQTLRSYAARLGVDSNDMDVLVANTGEPPGLMELLEAYRRGFIDKPRLERGIRQSRVRNEWIDTVEALRHSPMSTADAVRAVVENYITSDEGGVIAEQNGLIPEHWPIMVESWGRPLAHEQMLTLYHRGQATLEQVRQAMRESDIKNKYIEQSIELGRRLVPERQIVSMLQHGVVNRDTAMTMLKEQGYNDADADAFLRLGAAERLSTHKALTRTDLVAMYTDRLLTRQQASQHLESLGYSAVDATAMLDLADVKAKAATLRLVQRGVQASLRAHHITQQQAINQLEHAGIDNAQARELVDLWQQERVTPTRGLTEKQIFDAWAAKFITPQDGFARLQSLGLTATDALLLAKLQGLVPPNFSGNVPGDLPAP